MNSVFLHHDRQKQLIQETIPLVARDILTDPL